MESKWEYDPIMRGWRVTLVENGAKYQSWAMDEKFKNEGWRKKVAADIRWAIHHNPQAFRLYDGTITLPASL